MRRMERKLDITGEQVGTSRPKSSEDWRKKALYNMPEAAQERTSSSSDRDLKPDVDIASPSRRKQLRQQRWLENRGSGSVLSQSSESPRRWLQRQDSEVQSRPNERKSNTRLGQRKGGEPGESSKKPGEESEKQDLNEKPPFSDGRQDFNHHPKSEFKPYVNDAQVDEFSRLLEQVRQLRQYKDK